MLIYQFQKSIKQNNKINKNTSKVDDIYNLPMILFTLSYIYKEKNKHNRIYIYIYIYIIII